MLRNVTFILLNQNKSGTHPLPDGENLRTSSWDSASAQVRSLGSQGSRACPHPAVTTLSKGGWLPAWPSLLTRRGLGHHHGGSQSRRGQCPSPQALSAPTLLPRVPVWGWAQASATPGMSFVQTPSKSWKTKWGARLLPSSSQPLFPPPFC